MIREQQVLLHSELRQGVEQKANLLACVAALANGNGSVFYKILSEQVKEDVVNHLDFGKMLLADSKQPDEAKQKAILKLIITEQIAFHTLTIHHCTVLTDETLTALLKNAPETLSCLTLVDCPQITNKLSRVLEKHTPYLTTLTLRQLPKLEGLGNQTKGKANQTVHYNSINLSHLRRVNVSDNLQLSINVGNLQAQPNPH